MKDFNRMMGVMYDRAGLCLNLVERPLKRAHFELINGHVDGLIGRAQTYVDQNKDDIQVIQPAFLTNRFFILYDPNDFDDFDIASSFQGKRVAVPEGHVQAIEMAEKLGATVDEFKRAVEIEMIMDDRNLSGVIIEGYTKQDSWRDSEAIKKLTIKELESFAVYHVLSKTKIEEKEKLDKALGELVKEGSWGAMLDELESFEIN